MTALRAVNDALAFLLELAALAALAVWGFTVGGSWPLRILLGVGAPALMVVVWGFLLAPNAEHRLVMPLADHREARGLRQRHGGAGGHGPPAACRPVRRCWWS